MLLMFGLPLLMLGAFVAFVIWLVRRLMRPAMPVAA
jgi:flagellar biogenesis protein FliO